VLDIDNKGGRNGFGGLEQLGRAGLLRGALAIVGTPSGGRHIWFKGTDQGNRANIGGVPIDFRGKGGYVLVPPSVINGRAYTLLDWRSGVDGPGAGTIDMDAVTRLLTPRRSAPAAPRAAGGGDVVSLAGWLAKQQEGGRNAALYWAARRAVEAAAGDADFDLLADAALTAGLGEREVWATIGSARRTGGAR
jgi:hypothetical protein